MPTGKKSKKSKERVQRVYERTNLPDLRPADTLAVVVSDLHLCLTPPIFRSAEPDWLGAMLRPLQEVETVAGHLDAPIVYAGDIFDRWNASPELINWAIQHLPHGYAVPGQHDLPLHNYGDIKKSAYWTLVEAGKLTNLEPGKAARVVTDTRLILCGFPWGYPLKRLVSSQGKEKTMAVVHRYCWKPHYSDIPNPPLDQGYTKHAEDLEGFDAAVFGDNHCGFMAEAPNGLQIMNCGSMMVRRSDQRDYRPMIGIYLKAGFFVRYYLDTSQDVYLEEMSPEAELVLGDMDEFLQDLGSLASSGIDFIQTLLRTLKGSDITKQGRKVLERVVEEVLKKQEKQK